MNIIAKRTLKQFWEKHPQAEAPLMVWFAAVSRAQWDGPGDVKAAFGANVDFVADNRLIFDIGGNKFRLIVRVAYRHRQVMVKFIGTHAEYDRVDPTTI